MTAVDGYGSDPTEVQALLAALIADRDPSEPDESWWAYLSSRLALLTEAAGEVAALRDALVVEMLDTSSERRVAARLGLSPARPGQMARRARAKA